MRRPTRSHILAPLPATAQCRAIVSFHAGAGKRSDGQHPPHHRHAAAGDRGAHRPVGALAGGGVQPARPPHLRPLLDVERELSEETGLSLGTPPELARLDFLCSAVTPSTQPIRFDARFLVVDAAEVTGTLAGDGELEGLRWYEIEEALALDLAHVTGHVLRCLLEYLALPPEARRVREMTRRMLEREWTWE